MISSALLIQTLTAAGVPLAKISVFDSDYELPAPSWITGDLSSAFAKFLFDTGIQWTESRFDCNKFSKSASTIADWCWTKTRNASEAALALGLFAMPGHMLNVAIHLKQAEADFSREITVDDLRVAFYEPQPTVPSGEMVYAGVTLREVSLTAEECRNCLDCLFV